MSFISCGGDRVSSPSTLRRATGEMYGNRDRHECRISRRIFQPDRVPQPQGSFQNNFICAPDSNEALPGVI